MKRLYTFLWSLLLCPSLLIAQGENNICFFSTIETGYNTAIDFTGATPGITSYALSGAGTWWSSAVCKPNGQLRFIVQLTVNIPGAMHPNVFRPDGTAIAGTEFHTGMLTENCKPVVVPHPGNSDQYYIFYSYSKGLLYSLLDMSLNGGAGGIMPGKKDVLIAPYGTVVAKKMAAVKGCQGVWLVIRSRSENQFLSYGIDAAGLHMEPVRSEAGTFSMSYHYNYDDYGFLKASPDGTMLACCGWQGVELFPFEPCSGKITATKVLEQTGNGDPLAPSAGINHTRFQDVCFSPDNTKLYATENFWVNGQPDAGRLFQYTLNLTSLPAIIATKTHIITNLPTLMQDIGGFCTIVVQNPLGEIMAGPNGILYIDNGSATCLPPAAVPAGYNPGPGFHIIQFPNLPGGACLPQLNRLVVPYLGTSFSMGGLGGYSYLQQPIVTAPAKPDTLQGNSYSINTCFVDSCLLLADSNGSCYRWDNAMATRRRTVYDPGTYWVGYHRKDCSYITDTFRVTLTYLPEINTQGACPGQRDGWITASRTPADTGLLTYTWRSADGSILQAHHRQVADTLFAAAGIHTLNIGNGSCDTTILIEVPLLPAPVLSVSPESATIRYGDSIALHASGAVLYSWWPSGPLDTATKAAPVARPLQLTTFAVVGWNEHGCRDTGQVRIAIDYNMPDMLPNAFSPNGDGLNDVFRIEGISYQRLERFTVYNRYGQEVFSTAYARQGWDGTQNGRPCPAGTYYFYATLHYPDGSAKTVKGDITLIR